MKQDLRNRIIGVITHTYLASCLWIIDHSGRVRHSFWPSQVLRRLAMDFSIRQTLVYPSFRRAIVLSSIFGEMTMSPEPPLLPFRGRSTEPKASISSASQRLPRYRDARHSKTSVSREAGLLSFITKCLCPIPAGPSQESVIPDISNPDHDLAIDSDYHGDVILRAGNGIRSSTYTSQCVMVELLGGGCGRSLLPNDASR